MAHDIFLAIAAIAVLSAPCTYTAFIVKGKKQRPAHAASLFLTASLFLLLGIVVSTENQYQMLTVVGIPVILIAISSTRLVWAETDAEDQAIARKDHLHTAIHIAILASALAVIVMITYDKIDRYEADRALSMNSAAPTSNIPTSSHSSNITTR